MSGPHGIKNARRWPESGKLSNESSSGVLTASKFDLAAGHSPKSTLNLPALSWLHWLCSPILLADFRT